MARRKRIVLTAAGDGGLLEEPRLQALARLQPIRVLDTDRVEDDEDDWMWFGAARGSRADIWQRRWRRRYYGSHAKDILRRAEIRRLELRQMMLQKARELRRAVEQGTLLERGV